MSNTDMRTSVLIRNGLVEINGDKTKQKVSRRILGTVLSNLVYYGYVPSKEAVERLSELSKADLEAWWRPVETVLKEITGASRKIDKFVVYKNFPKEVLDMSSAQYWFSQIFMYLGVPNEFFTEDEEDRECMLDKLELKVLHLADSNSLRKICEGLLRNPARWTKDQFKDTLYLVIDEGIPCDIPSISFKENMAKLVAQLIEKNVEVGLRSATDVLRLAIGMSDGDVSMVKPSKFRTFSRAERKFFLGMLEKTTSLEEDLARRKNVWKKFMRALRPNDYGKRFANVCKAYDALYNNKVKTFNSKVEELCLQKDKKVLNLLQHRGGEYVRRLHQMVDLFGEDAIKKFSKVLPSLTVMQLLKISKYVDQINNRVYRTFAPKGNWTKLQVVDNERGLSEDLQVALLGKINREIAKRVREKYATINLHESAKMVKIQTNDSDLSPYGRGTEFPIPENIKFIRTASYWQCDRGYNTWFDNGWNFFDENWKSIGVCCWTDERFGHGKMTGAIFSGDPTNSKEMKGRACQMIDLYLDELERMGVRYAVWNILCYSNIPFNQAEDVFAAMQWGEEPQKGKLFEPSRCQLSFPVTGESKTKYIAYLDVLERKVVYMDVNLYGNVSSANTNGPTLEEKMPAFQEYLDTIPSVHDLFKGVRKSKKGLPVAYDDSELELDGVEAYVFKPVNEENKFEQVDLTKLLS